MQVSVLLLVGVLSLLSPQDTLKPGKITAAGAEVSASAPVTVIGAGVLARSGAQEVHELLRNVAGLSVKDYGGAGGMKTVSVRSLGSGHTAVNYDGIAVADIQNGQTDISLFNLDNMDEISVEIGASDEIFRRARHLSSGGILSLKPAMPVFNGGNTNMKAAVTAGSFGTVRPFIRIDRKLSKTLTASVSAKYLHSRGDYPFLLRNGDETTTERRLGAAIDRIDMEANLYGKFRSGSRLRGKIMFHDSDRGLPGPVILYTQNPTEHLRDMNLIADLDYRFESGGKWKLEGSTGYIRSRTRYTDTRALYAEKEDNRYLSEEASACATVQFSPSARFRFVISEDLFFNMLHSNLPAHPFPKRLSSATAVSGQYRSGRWIVTASLLALNIKEKVSSGEAPPLRSQISPTVSASFRIAGNLRLRASYKDGYRVPTFNDLYYDRIGNRNLRPETAALFNAGITWHKEAGTGNVRISADCHSGRVRDKIVAVPTMFIWRMRNVGKADVSGIDLCAAFQTRITEEAEMDLRASYSFLKAVDVTDSGSKEYGHQIQYTPRHSGSLSAALRTKWLNLHYSLSASGKRYFLPQNLPANMLPPYTEHEVSIQREFKAGPCRISASIQALNLSGDNYEIVRCYPMPGRNYRLTIKILYK